MSRFALFLALPVLFNVGCGGESPSDDLDPLAGIQLIGDDLSDIPLHGSSKEQVARFKDGDALFDFVFRERDGLGPLYIRASCAGCHEGAARGPGAVQKMVLVEADGLTPAVDQAGLPYGHTMRPYGVAGATTLSLPGTDVTIKLSQRLGPPVFGRGYMEAVDDAEIERVAAEQAARGDAIRGRINRVVFHSKKNGDETFHTFAEGDENLIGRFGFKARVATLDDFTADAYQGDMGITSPLRPHELPNPDGLTDDAKPGEDVVLDTVNAVADYMRLLEIPRRAPADARGEALFEEADCAVCHVPSLRTRADYPIEQLADIDAPVYTDFLLHDLGPDLADGLADESASSVSWRTAPLIGMRHSTAYLHDGRARTIEQAILLHDGEGSEAAASVAAFRALSREDRQALIDFVRSL
ncbi:di-heme oxidoredictase family protein [Sorangium sp. So ce1389]|uniref:di-heme oxidoredictase family protein n=1 Tax=Sorangium sp. So ce1389 TaxID=3133336 RepID=UPI003F6045D4